MPDPVRLLAGAVFTVGVVFRRSEHADGIDTQRALTKYPGIFHEADPIARPLVSRGWRGQIAGGTLFVAADVGLRYLVRRTS